MEYLWVQFLNGGTAVSLAVFVYRSVDVLDVIVLGGLELVEVFHCDFRATGLVIFPSIEFHGGIEVGVDHDFVVFLQVGLVDARDGKSSGTYTLSIDEVGEDLLSRLQAEFVCH